MTFAEIITEICARANDPLKDVYGDRAEQLFVQAVGELATDTSIVEIQELVIDAVEEAVLFADNEASVDIKKGTIKVLDVYIDPADLVTSNLILKEVEHSDIKRMNLEPAFAPGGDECFWYRVMNQVRFLLSPDWEGPTSIEFNIQIINSPNQSDWTGDMTTQHGYSTAFLYRCIDNAVVRLREELI